MVQEVVDYCYIVGGVISDDFPVISPISQISTTSLCFQCPDDYPGQ